MAGYAVAQSAWGKATMSQASSAIASSPITKSIIAGLAAIRAASSSLRQPQYSIVPATIRDGQLPGGVGTDVGWLWPIVAFLPLGLRLRLAKSLPKGCCGKPPKSRSKEPQNYGDKDRSRDGDGDNALPPQHEARDEDPEKGRQDNPKTGPDDALDDVTTSQPGSPSPRGSGAAEPTDVPAANPKPYAAASVALGDSPTTFNSVQNVLYRNTCTSDASTICFSDNGRLSQDDVQIGTIPTRELPPTVRSNKMFEPIWEYPGARGGAQNLVIVPQVVHVGGQDMVGRLGAMGDDGQGDYLAVLTVLDQWWREQGEQAPVKREQGSQPSRAGLVLPTDLRGLTLASGLGLYTGNGVLGKARSGEECVQSAQRRAAGWMILVADVLDAVLRLVGYGGSTSGASADGDLARGGSEMYGSKSVSAFAPTVAKLLEALDRGSERQVAEKLRTTHLQFSNQHISPEEGVRQPIPHVLIEVLTPAEPPRRHPASPPHPPKELQSPLPPRGRGARLMPLAPIPGINPVPAPPRLAPLPLPIPQADVSSAAPSNKLPPLVWGVAEKLATATLVAAHGFSEATAGGTSASASVSANVVDGGTMAEAQALADKALPIWRRSAAAALREALQGPELVDSILVIAYGMGQCEQVEATEQQLLNIQLEEESPAALGSLSYAALGAILLSDQKALEQLVRSCPPPQDLVSDLAIALAASQQCMALGCLLGDLAGLQPTCSTWMNTCLCTDNRKHQTEGRRSTPRAALSTSAAAAIPCAEHNMLHRWGSYWITSLQPLVSSLPRPGLPTIHDLHLLLAAPQAAQPSSAPQRMLVPTLSQQLGLTSSVGPAASSSLPLPSVSTTWQLLEALSRVPRDETREFLTTGATPLMIDESTAHVLSTTQEDLMSRVKQWVLQSGNGLHVLAVAGAWEALSTCSPAEVVKYLAGQGVPPVAPCPCALLQAASPQLHAPLAALRAAALPDIVPPLVIAGVAAVMGLALPGEASGAASGRVLLTSYLEAADDAGRRAVLTSGGAEQLNTEILCELTEPQRDALHEWLGRQGKSVGVGAAVKSQAFGRKLRELARGDSFGAFEAGLAVDTALVALLDLPIGQQRAFMHNQDASGIDPVIMDLLHSLTPLQREQLKSAWVDARQDSEPASGDVFVDVAVGLAELAVAVRKLPESQQIRALEVAASGGHVGTATGGPVEKVVARLSGGAKAVAEEARQRLAVLQGVGKVPPHVGLGLIALGREVGQEYAVTGLLNRGVDTGVKAVLQGGTAVQQAAHRQVLAKFLDAGAELGSGKPSTEDVVKAILQLGGEERAAFMRSGRAPIGCKIPVESAPADVIKAAREQIRHHLYGGDVSESTVRALMQMDLPQLVAFIEHGIVQEEVIPAHVALQIRQISQTDMALLATLNARKKLDEFLTSHVQLGDPHAGTPALPTPVLLNMVLTGQTPSNAGSIHTQLLAKLLHEDLTCGEWESHVSPTLGVVVPWDDVQQLKRLSPSELLRLLNDPLSVTATSGAGGDPVNVTSLLSNDIRDNLRNLLTEGADQVRPQVVAALKLLSQDARAKFLDTGTLHSNVEPSLAAALRAVSLYERQQLRRRWGTLEVDTDPSVKAAMRLLQMSRSSFEQKGSIGRGGRPGLEQSLKAALEQLGKFE